MKTAGLTLLLLAAAPLSAQRFETGLFLGQQQCDSFSYGVRGPFTVGAAPEANRVIAGRFGVSLADFGPARLVATLGYQPENSTPMRQQGYLFFANELQYGYVSVGTGVAMTSIVALSANLELRSEHLGYGSGPVNWNRAWLRFNLSYTFQGDSTKPFIGLEMASALSHQSLKQNGYDTVSDELRAIAPKVQTGVYVGIRF
jgi:hypothetical protein